MERSGRSWVTLLLATVLVLPLALLGPTTGQASAAPPGLGILTLDKTVVGQTGTPTYSAGESFAYQLRVSCSNLDGPGCGDVQVNDALPDPLVFDPAFANPIAVAGVGNAYNVARAGTVATINITQPLGGGEVGLEGGGEAVITIRVQVPPDTPSTFSGPVVNTGRATQSNGDPRTSSVTVNLEIEEELASTVTKTVDAPGGTPVAAVPGEPVDWTIGGRNTSNGPVDTLVIQDPAEGASGDPFQYLALTGISTFTPPTGADRVQVDWRDDTGAWQNGTVGAIPADITTLLPGDLSTVHGLRFTFSAATGRLPVTPADGSAVITYNTETRDNVSTLPANTTVTVTNVVSSHVTSGATSSTPVTQAANVGIRREPPTVTLDKEFTDPVLTAGESTTATLTAVVGNTPVSTLVITEPDGSADLAAQGLTFTGFGSALEWPPGATSATIQYLYADGFTEGPRSTATVDTLPVPTTGHRVAGFTVTYEGRMTTGATAVLPFEVTADRVDTPVDVTTPNTASAHVTGVDGQQSDVVSDTDDLTRQPLRVTTATSKNIAKDSMYAFPGATTVVSVPARVNGPDGPNGSTVGSQYLQVTDPASPGAAPSEFWDHFDLVSIAPTDVPAVATMTISYWDGSQWTNLPGATNVVGPVDSFSLEIPASLRPDIQGIRYTFTPTDPDELLPPGFQVLPYFRVDLRSTLRSDPGTSALPTADTTYTNDVESEVRNPLAVVPTDTAQGTDSVLVRPVPPGGPGTIDKGYVLPNGSVSVDAATIVALTDDRRTARIGWSTQDVPMSSVRISDPATAPDNVANSPYDAFDLASIGAINSANDPLMTFDAVSRVELFTGGAWTDITAQACPTTAACDGQFPGYTLTDPQRADALGVRLTFVESPTRASRITGPDDPPVGSGVAGSDDNGRPIDLVYQLRQQLRSDPSQPVLGVDRGPIYNSGTRGIVQNTARLEGTTVNGTFNGVAAAEITILDRDVNVSITKAFDQTVLGLPQSGTDPADFPLATATLVATNEDVPKVRRMEIEDPTGGSATFDTLNLYQVAGVTVPIGATATTVTLSRGSTDTDYTIAEALALTPAQLADVTGVRVVHTGLIATQATSQVQLVFQLRPTHRSGGAAVVAGDRVDNIAQVTGTSPGTSSTTTAEDEINIVQPTYGVTAGKTISPSTRTEVQPRTGYVVTLTGQPTGTVRTLQMTMTDDRPTFWNAFDLASLRPVTVPLPITRVRLDVLTGVTYDLEDDELVATCNGNIDLTACWTQGTATTLSSRTWNPQLPGGISAGAVQGLRVVADKADGTRWERPANPQVTFSFNATRREFLRYGNDGGTDTPVPSTKPDLPPAPGETDRGTFTDGVDVHLDGAWLNQGDPWVADGTATATTRLTHLQNRISVTKAPGNGNQTPGYAPGTEIPYVMTFQNTGQWPMTGLTIVDQIASNENGSLLTWPEDENGDPEPSYSFALFNAGGQAQPVTGFSADLDTDTGELAVTVPPGFVFQPGWRLVLSTDLIFQEGLAPGTAVVNNVTATSDRIFDGCTHTLNNRPDGTLNNVEECTSTTTTEPTAAAPIRVVKSVKGEGGGVPGASPGDANYDDLGVIQLGLGNDASACGAPNAANGYYRYPCVPITRAGGHERWQISLTNQGNIPAGVIAGIDVLPRYGDTGVTISQPRLSQFRTTLIGNFASNAATVDNLAKTFRIYYTTQNLNVACNAADIRNETLPAGLPTTDPCYGEVTGGRGWTLVDASTTPAQLAAATSIKSVAEYTNYLNDEGLAPGRTLHVSFETETAAFPNRAQGPGLDAIAYNSAAVGARGVSGSESQVTNVLEPRKVGVALASGAFDLEKTVVVPDGLTVPLPTTYPFKVTCTSAGQDIPLVNAAGQDVSTVQLTRDQVLHFNGGSGTWGQVNLPRYAECTLTELGSQGATVTFDPPGTGNTSGTVEALSDYSDRSDVANPAYPVPVPLEQVSATNTYQPAGFSVSKAVVQGGALDQDGNPVSVDDRFTFTASCRFNGTEVVPAADRSFTLRGGEAKTFGALPAGATCTVTETGSGSSTTTSHVVTQGSVVGTPQNGKTSSLTLAPDDAMGHTNASAFTNTYAVGTITVTKNVAGDGADPWGNGPFEVRLVCTLANAAPTPVYDGTHELTRTASTWRVDNLPTGAACTVTETRNGGANATTISPGNGRVTVGNGTVVAVTVTNTFTTSGIQVTKRVTGDTDELPAALTGTYTVSLACTRTVDGVATPIAIPGGATRVLNGNGAIVTYTGLPTGASCRVTETDSDPQAQETTVAPSQVTVGSVPSTPAQVVVTNRFRLGSLRVIKDVTGLGGTQYGAGPFEVTLACQVDGSDITIPGGAVRTLSETDGLRTLYRQLPVGAECALTETDDGGADSTSISVRTNGGDPVETPGTSTDVVIRDDSASAGNGPAAVIATVTNTFEVGSVQVSKVIAGDGSAFVDGPFEVRIDCTRQVSGQTVDVTIPGGAVRELTRAQPTATWSSLPRRATCAVTETDDGGADTAVVSPAEVTVGGAPAEVTATNTFLPAGFTVSKSVDDGGAVDQDGQPIVYDQTYDFETSCELNGNPLSLPDDYAAFTLAADETQTLDGLPVGAQCTVEETGAGSAASTTYVVTEDSVPGTEQDGSTAEVTLAGDVDGAHVNAVDFTNHYTVGSLSITKEVSGPGADPWANHQFLITVRCTSDLTDPEVVYDSQQFLDRANRDWRIDNLPTGTECTVAEDPDNDGGATFTTINPDDGVVTIGPDGSNTDVTVTNFFGLGSIEVGKLVDGDTDELPEALDGTYTVSLACGILVNGEFFDVAVPGGPVREITTTGGTGSVTYDNLPTRAACTVSEIGSDPQSQEIEISPDVVIVGDDESQAPRQVQVTNTFHLGALQVTKDVIGPGGELWGSGPFEVSLSCLADVDGEPTDVPIPGGAVRTLSAANDLSVLYTQLPVGAECDLEETGTGGANSTSITVTPQGGPPVVTEGTGASVVIQDDTASTGDGSPAGVVADITNRFDVGSVRVRKELTGPAATLVTQDFTVRLDCSRTVDGDQVGVRIPDGATRTLSKATGLRDGWGQLPVGATCEVTEPRDGSAEATTIRPSQLVVRDGAAATVTVTNRFECPQTSSGTGGTSAARALTVADDPCPNDVGDNGDNQGDNGGWLPDTGSDVSVWLIALAALCLLGGAVLVGVARRR